MKYMMLINLGPKARDWAEPLRGRAQTRSAGFQALNQTPGVTPGIGLAPPETATTVRVQDGKTLTTDGPYVETKEALDGYLHRSRPTTSTRRSRWRRRSPRRAWAARSRSARRWSGETSPRAGLPRAVGVRARCADRLPRRLRPRRGSHAGGVRDRRRALAARRHAGEPRRLADHDRPPAGDRPHPPRARAGRQDPTARRAAKRPRTPWTRRHSPTSGWSSSSPAAIRRSPPTRRSR